MKLLFVLGIMIPSLGFCQNATDNLENNRIINRYFPGELFTSIESNEPILYNKLLYYFTQSFDVESVSCPTCPIDYTNLFNIELFDVLENEGSRLPASSNSIFSKNGNYLISLHSTQSLEANLGGISVNEMIIQTFPDWNNSGDIDEDIESYRNDVKRWLIVFKNQFDQMLANPDLLQISLDEFLSYSPIRQNAVMAHPFGYLIKLP